MKNNSIRNAVKIALLVVPVIMLPGCGALEWVKDKLGMSKPKSTNGMEMEKKTRKSVDEAGGDSTALVTLGGKTVITLETLEQELDQFFAGSTESKMPEIKHPFLMGFLVSQVIMDEWVDRNLSNDSEYKQELKDMMKQTKRLVNQKHFSKHHPVDLSDEELRAFYDKYKNQYLMESRGGINAVGIRFDDEASAQAFLSQAKENGLSSAAEKQGMASRVSTFKEVGQYTPGIDQAVRESLMGMTSFPDTALVKSGDSYWVVQGLSKDEPKYRDFDQAKEMLRPEAAKEKNMEHIKGVISKYKNEYDVQVNEDAVKSDEPAMQDMPDDLSGLEDKEEEGPTMPQPA